MHVCANGSGDPWSSGQHHGQGEGREGEGESVREREGVREGGEREL